MRQGTFRRHWKRWTLAAIGLVVLGVLGGPFIYIHFVQGKAPPPLALSPAATATASASPSASGSPATATGTDGAWNVGDGSVVGYRVKEVLFGQSNVAVGRTNSITGSMTVNGTTITAATFTVDMTTVTSDESRRDGQFNGRIMETDIFPTATFTLTKPIELGSIPAVGTHKTYKATGNLTMHGVTKEVTFEVNGQFTGTVAQVAGSIPVTFADWNIPNPSFAAITTEDHGELEFALNFTRG